MFTTTRLIVCLQLWSLHTTPKSGIMGISADHPQLATQVELKAVNNHTDDKKKVEMKKSHDHDFDIDGLKDLIDRLNYDELGGEVTEGLETYNPITNTLISGTKTKTDDSTWHNHSFQLDLSSHQFQKTGHSTEDLSSSHKPRPDIKTRSHHMHDVDTDCPERCECLDTEVKCAGQNLTSVPPGISHITTHLDLSLNNLQTLADNTFSHMTNLRELKCADNQLTELPTSLFRHNRFLQILNFRGNMFSRVPSKIFQNLTYLLELRLDNNNISSISNKAFLGLVNLKELGLDYNKLQQVPIAALRNLTALQALTLIQNNISHLQDYTFRSNPRLIQLRLANNSITKIADQTFYGLTKLKFLELQQNKLMTMPSAFSHLISLEELNLDGNLLTEIPDKSFRMKEKLTRLILDNNPISFVADMAFSNLPSLRELKLLQVKELTRFPDLTGTKDLNTLLINRANIRSLPADLCVHSQKLKILDVNSNRIGAIPSLSLCKYLKILNIGNNQLNSIDGQLFEGMDQLQDLTLSVNNIHILPEETFVGLGALEYLDLSHNQISIIHPNAFLPLKSLKNLNLARNRFHHLPTAGLVSLERLKVFHVDSLQEFPPKEQFPKVNEFVLSYAYHCCDFIHSGYEKQTDSLDNEYMTELDNISESNLARHTNFSTEMLNFLKNITVDYDLWDRISHQTYELSSHHLEAVVTTKLRERRGHAISCKPLPGPFIPCDDLFGWWSLRVGVWVVFISALLGNGLVFFVSVTSKSKMDVPRFLICNLAVADFFMGIYLGILAILDVSTFGHFKRYAIQWQRSGGCLVAGTLAVLSSELSVFTLTTITLERLYAIIHAMQLNKRLSLKHAGFIMTCGWIWSFGLAILPLFGISDYRKFAVCLPFKIEDPISKSYVCFLMIFNGVSFIIILACYFIMYLSIRDSQAWNSSDTRVAKRMALLVFTDFLCWAPIALLSLTAAFGQNLVHLNAAKVLTIFILPLNSCANPFLYAFFTKQFKKDCDLLCRRLEDSFLAKHFSQATQHNVTLTCKKQHQSSVLHSLMGDSMTNNSHNTMTNNSHNFTTSTSCGFLNLNSEINSGSKSPGNEVNISDKYFLQTTMSSTSRNYLFNSYKMYKNQLPQYKPCPKCENEQDNSFMKNEYADLQDDDENHQAVLQRT